MAYKTSSASLWTKKVLVPCWVIQDVILIILIGLYSSVFPEISRRFFLYDYIRYTVYPLAVAFASISLVLNVAETVLFIRHNLSPRTYFLFQLVKMVLWLVIFVMDLVVLVQSQNFTYIIVDHVIESGFMLLSVLVSLIYSSVIYHRHRRNLQRGIYYSAPHSHQQNGISLPENETSQQGIAVMGSLRTENYNSFSTQAPKYILPTPTILRQPPTPVETPRTSIYVSEVSRTDGMPVEADGREVVEISAKQ